MYPSKNMYHVLGEWIAENAPELYKRTEHFDQFQNLEALNELTGLSLTSDGMIEDDCQTFLEALKKMKAEGKELK